MQKSEFIIANLKGKGERMGSRMGAILGRLPGSVGALVCLGLGKTFVPNTRTDLLGLKRVGSWHRVPSTLE